MKRLVVCCDGTWQARDAAGNGSTNVAKMAQAILPKAPDGTRQVVWYDAGVGTSGGRLARMWAGATGKGLARNVEQAYRFLCETYERGDELWLFGFSRGAFTVRSVAGMVRKCGLLRPDQLGHLEDAYRFYRGKVHPDDPEAIEFRRLHARPREVRIRFLGVWDTVGSLGIPWGPLRVLSRRRHGFHDVRLSRIVDTARHAVAIDERRRSFRPTLWETKPVPGQSVEQAWFAGVHSAVGGGQGPQGLPDLAFLWMKDAARAAGLRVDERYVRRTFRPDATVRLVESRTGIWRILPGGWRPIGDPRHQPQAIHPSALRRHADAALGYRPRNLVRYLTGLTGPAAPQVATAKVSGAAVAPSRARRASSPGARRRKTAA